VETNRVVGDVAGGGAEVDDGGGEGAAGGERMHVRHDVVAHAALLLLRARKVDVLEVGAHLLKLRLADLQAQLLQPQITRVSPISHSRETITFLSLATRARISHLSRFANTKAAARGRFNIYSI